MARSRTCVAKSIREQRKKDNTKIKKRAQKQVKASVEFFKKLGWFEEEKKKTCLQTLHIQ